MSTPASPPNAADGPGVVLLNWSEEHRSLVAELSRTMGGGGVARITCVGDGLDDGDSTESDDGLAVHWIAMEPRLSLEDLVAKLDEIGIVRAQSVIVLPQSEASDPDSLSRLMCSAIRKACGETGPNVLVEVEDPEAAFEFAGLGVSTVFYSGHLRAALLGQASVDLGVFQFILGLLRGRYRVRTIAVPEGFESRTFADAALDLETDAHGRPMTVIGVARPAAQGGGVLTNPGPQFPLRDADGLLVLVSGAPAKERAVG